jgi:acetoin utilization deacetylase AcuC-like enzyme
MNHALTQRFPAANSRLNVHFHPDCLLHEEPLGHPERPERLQAILDGCLTLDPTVPVSFVIPETATFEQLLLVHDKSYLQRLEEATHHQSTFMSPDNYLCPDSFDAIRAAAGCAIAAAGSLLSGTPAFALTRPPGHHAGRSTAEGFCFVNHIALAIETLRRSKPDARFLVVDFDIHHGNGIDQIYQRDDSVFYYSIHGNPAHIYPSTGFPDETGKDTGRGYTRNVTVDEGTSGDDWLQLFRSSLREVEKSFTPDYLLIGAGFDAHAEDPFSLAKLQDTHYLEVASDLKALANAHCHGRAAWFLEGGYSTTVLNRLVPKVIKQLAKGN